MIKDEIVVFPAHEYGAIEKAAIGKRSVVENIGFIAVHKSVKVHANTAEKAVEKCYNQAVRSNTDTMLA